MRTVDHYTDPKEINNESNVVAFRNKKGIDLKATLPKSMPKLKTLHLKRSQISSLDGIPSSAPILTDVNLENNALSTLNHFPSDATQLETLIVSKNQLESFHGLPASQQLNYIDASENKLKSIATLPSHLPNLQIFVAKNNEIDNLKQFPNTTQLFAVNVSNNKLTSLEGLPPMQPMQLKLGSETKMLQPYVNFCGNPLQTLKGLPKSAFMRSVHDFEQCLDQTDIDADGKALLKACGASADKIPENEHMYLEKSSECTKAWQYFNKKEKN